MGAQFFPVVTVNGREIPPAAIAAEAQNHPAPPGKPGLAWRAAARALALREVLLDEARLNGLEAKPQMLAPDQLETEEEALIRQLVEQAIDPPAPKEEDLQAIWSAHPERFRAPDLWEASHILLAAQGDDTEARAKAKALANRIAEALRQDPGRFADLARDHSACSSRSAGGTLGQIGPGDTVPEFEAALQDLTAGQIGSDPVETRFGFHIIRLDAHAKGEPLPFLAVRSRLETAARKVLWTRAAQAYAVDLMGRATITGL